MQENTQQHKKLPELPPQTGSVDRRGSNNAVDTVEHSIDTSLHNHDLATQRRPSTTREEKLYQNVQNKQKDIQSLEVELENVLREKASIQREWKEAASELNRLRADPKYKVDDSFFVEAWKELRYEIKNWAFHHFGGDLKPAPWSRAGKSTAQTSKHIKSLVYDYKLFLRSPQLRPLLMQAVVWHMLSRHVFMSHDTKDGVIWAGYRYWDFRGLYNLLIPVGDVSMDQLKAFHKWRADTAQLLHPKVDEKACGPRANQVVEHIWGKIHNYITSNDKDFRSGLLKIVSKAARLDAEFMKQRAILGPRMPKSKEGVPYGYEPMHQHFESDNDFETLDEHQIVDLIVAPGLGKQGDADGDNYNVDTLLVKCRVVQKASAQQRSQSLSPISSSNMVDVSPQESLKT